ncbi:hypothetical protein SLS58_007245 [Diplodia intermedia]|uniref:Poly(A) RNA polymerase mitochondrial-like central palm domain-containing protein n=1 Tax=Diplodia intermedia TaxID=856260 RepID=A0ABR3TLN1_9PEZI
MLSDRTICCAGNALRPYAVLSRLFGIPLARTRPLPALHCSVAAFSTTVRHRSDNRDPHARNVDVTSLDITLEAHRRANREELLRKVTPKGESVLNARNTVWLRPELSPDRFDPLSVSGEQPKERKNGKNGKNGKTGKTGNTGQTFKRLSVTGKTENTGRTFKRVAIPDAPDRVVPPPDYLGQYVEPLHDRDDVRDEDLPWFASSLRSGATSMERLRAEIEAFTKYVQPTPEEHAGRLAVVDQTRETWSRFVSGQGRKVQHLQLEIFGSQRTGLATATSDIDFRIYNPEVEKESDAKKAPKYRRRNEYTSTLQQVFPFYEKDENFMLVFLRHARYPLISMQHAPTSVDVQLVSSNDTAHAREVAAKYMEELPAIRTLYMLFRHMLEIRGLCDVFRGGIASYSIFYMIAAGMKLGPPAAHDDPATQLLAVLDFYSDFDATSNWISLAPLAIWPKVENKPVQSKNEKRTLATQRRIGLQNEDQPYLFCLRDPADDTNDLGRKTFNWKHLQETLKTLRKELYQKLERDDGSLLLTPLVGRSFELMEARREQLVAFGRQYPLSRQALEVPVVVYGEGDSETAKEVPGDLQGEVTARQEETDSEAAKA